jgi:hypothetical protein
LNAPYETPPVTAQSVILGRAVEATSCRIERRDNLEKSNRRNSTQ